MQHWEPRSAELPGLRLQYNGAGCVHKGLGQWGEDQDMARGVRVGEWDIVREHTDGECEELHNHRPVLLLIKGLPEPDLRRLFVGRFLQKHKGHVRCAEPSNPLRLQ